LLITSSAPSSRNRSWRPCARGSWVAGPGYVRPSRSTPPACGRTVRRRVLHRSLPPPDGDRGEPSCFAPGKGRAASSVSSLLRSKEPSLFQEPNCRWLPRVVLGCKNIRASEAAPVKSQRTPARATNSGRATVPVLGASCRPFSASVLTSYIEGQCRLLYYCNTNFKELRLQKARVRVASIHVLPLRGLLGN
jgi:hypothetical protein